MIGQGKIKGEEKDDIRLSQGGAITTDFTDIKG